MPAEFTPFIFDHLPTLALGILLGLVVSLFVYAAITRQNPRATNKPSQNQNPHLDLLRATIDALPSHLAVLDHTGVIRLVNERWRQFARDGNCSDERSSLGTNYFQVCKHAAQCTDRPQDALEAQRVLDQLQAVLRGDRPEAYLEYPCHGPTPDQQRWFQLRARRFSLGPSPSDVYLVISHEQITETISDHLAQRRHIHQLAHVARLTLVGEMASGLAHELNQPLSAMVSYAQGARRLIDQHLQHSDKSSAQQSLILSGIDRAVAQAQRAANMLARVRSFTKVHIHQPATINLEQCAQTVIEMLNSEVTRSGIEVQLYNHTQADDALVIADPLHVQQILINITRNALEATAAAHRKNPIQIIIALDDTSNTDQQFIRVSVVDQGVGMTTKQQQHVFHPFITSKSDGLGLGLTICEKLAREQGGYLGFRSEQGAGTTFWLKLPIAATSTLSTQPQSAITFQNASDPLQSAA